LIAALAVFVGTHFLMSHPLRARMVAALGNAGFPIVYSLISLASFFWAIVAFREAPISVPLWNIGDLIWWIATVLMLIGSILFAGSIAGNPALPRPDAAALAKAPVHGVFAITRHPMMWGFAIWGVVHILASGQMRTIILAIGLIFLALVGSAGQDRKKAMLMGDDWADWRNRTSFIPFGNQVSGTASWRTAWPGRRNILLGLLLWLGASWLHPYFGGPIAGLFRWIG
jgi:uncharacterized membrane protein